MAKSAKIVAAETVDAEVIKGAISAPQGSPATEPAPPPIPAVTQVATETPPSGPPSAGSPSASSGSASSSIASSSASSGSRLWSDAIQGVEDIPKDAEIAFQTLKGLMGDLQAGVSNAAHFSTLAVHDIEATLGKAYGVLQTIKRAI